MATDDQSIGKKVDPITCVKCGRMFPAGEHLPLAPVVCPFCGKNQWAPMRIGHFLLLEFLGEGGMGRVFRALDEALNREVAIKVMHPEIARDRENAARFIREARAAAALNHPNIVQIYACEQQGDQIYIVMELMSGGRLDQLMDKQGPLDEKKVLQIALKITEGLNAARNPPLVHGDIKPANILFDTDGHAKISDFGLARFGKQQTQTDGLWGTPYYIAPEKVRQQPETPQSDIYSLGGSLYHALAGQPPFEGPTAKDVVLARLQNSPKSLGEVRPGLHAKTIAVIHRMLEPTPFKRYPTHGSVLADLRGALEDVETGDERRATEHKKFVRRLIVGMGVGLVALALLALFVVWALTPPEKPAAGAQPAAAAGSNAVAAAAATNAKPVVAEAPPARLQPFPSEKDAQLAQAIGLWIQNGTADVERVLRPLDQESKPGTMAHFWLVFQRGIMAQATGQPEAGKFFAEVAGGQMTERVADPKRNPMDYLKLMADYMLGKKSDSEVLDPVFNMPDWFKDYFTWLQGLRQLTSGPVQAGKDRLEKYAGRPSGSPLWAYACQPLAAKLMAECDRLEAFQKDMDALLKKMKFDDAAIKLAGFRATALPALQPGLEALAQRVAAEKEKGEAGLRAAEEKKRKGEEAKRAEAEAAHQALVREDMARLEQIRTALKPGVLRMEYSRARTALRDQPPAMQTDEGRTASQNLGKELDRMEGLKRHLMTALEGKPYSDPDLGPSGGAVVGANPQGIRISLGSVGAIQRPWNQVKAASFVRMVQFFINSPDMPAADKAELYAGLAFFSDWNGGAAYAAKCAQQAIQLNPALEGELKRLAGAGAAAP